MNRFIIAIDKEEKHFLFLPRFFLLISCLFSCLTKILYQSIIVSNGKSPLIIGHLGRYRTALHAKQIIQIPPSAPRFDLEMFSFQGLFFYFSSFCSGKLLFAFFSCLSSCLWQNPVISGRVFSFYNPKLLIYACCLLACSSIIRSETWPYTSSVKAAVACPKAP